MKNCIAEQQRNKQHVRLVETAAMLAALEDWDSLAVLEQTSPIPSYRSQKPGKGCYTKEINF